MSDDLIPPGRLVRQKRDRGFSLNKIGVSRKRTTPTKRLTKNVIKAGWVELGGDPGEIQRPKTRADCANIPRPCVFVSCRHHLYLEITQNGSLTINRPDVEVHEMKHSCSIDVAEGGARTLDEIGQTLGITRERARQVELRALVGKLKGTKAVNDLG